MLLIVAFLSFLTTPESPTITINGVIAPSFEKILTDIFADDDLFIAYQGRELINIFENINKEFGINFKSLLRYASRRRVKEKIMKFILENTNIS